MKDRHWNSLVATLRRGQCVLVLGPEVPVAGGSGAPPTFADAIGRTLADELEADGRRAAGKTLAALAQQYEDSDGFGATALRAEVERFHRSAPCAPSRAHELLATLPFVLVLTTCLDGLLGQAIQAAGKTPITQRYHLRADRRANPEFTLPGTPGAPVIYHLFGTAEEPSSMVLSENDILDFLIAIVSENPPVPNSLMRMLRRPGLSFLFVGFGVRHWHLRVLLKVILRALALDRSGSAVVAESLRSLAESDRQETILFYQRGTRVEVEDDEVTPFLEALSRRYEDEGGYVGPTAASGRGARVFISHAREDRELAARVQQALQAAHFEPWVDRDDLVGGEDWNLHIESELQATDFTLVLYTPMLARKLDGYVNKELALARERASYVRGTFLIPLRTHPPSEMAEVRELGSYNQMDLRDASFDEDIAKVVSTMTREIQRRNR